MGFPVGYTEVLIPSLFIHTLTILTIMKKLVLTIFQYLGIPSDYLEPLPLDVDIVASPPAATSCPRQPPLSAMLLRELLPVVEVQVPGGEEDVSETVRCAVCLYDLCGGEEMRWLVNCKHIFHRDCLDRWMDLDHRTCPLCRTPFLPDHMLHQFNQRLLSAHAFDHPLEYVDNNHNHTLIFSSL